MTRTRFWMIAICIAVGLTTVGASQTGTWPPGLQTVSTESPALSPAAEMKTFVLPPGYRVELVASEPMVENPILIDWDPSGRLWVIELIGYMQDLPATNEHEPSGRISVLEDTNGDGTMDTKSVFAQGLVLPRALKVLDKGVLVAEPPHLWFIPFASEPGASPRAGAKQLVCDCYGTALANVEHNTNGLLWALDNWIHTAEGDTYLRLKDGKFETRRTLSRGQWGVTQDDFGHVYRNSNSSALHIDLVSTPYFARHPNLLSTRGSYEFMGDQGELNVTFPVRPNPGVNRGYVQGQLRADGTLATFTAVNSPMVYRGDRLPAQLLGNVFVAEPTGNLVSRMIVADDGRSLRAKKAYQNAEFLVSTDERFRPVYLSPAPDGTIYVVDMYHGIIQHKGFITEYLRDQILSRKLEVPINRGRIFRIVHDTMRRDSRPALSTAPIPRLVETLSHPNGWWRDTAQRLLVERREKSSIAPLKALAENAKDVRTRLHAMWTLDGMDAIEPATIVKALGDTSRDIRVSAIRIAERWMSDAQSPIQPALAARLDDADWNVQEQLAASLGALPAPLRETRLAALLEKRGDNPVVIDAAISGLRGSESGVLTKLLQPATQSAQREAAITMLAATITRGAQDADVQSLFERSAETTLAEWQRSALLRGAEVALLGAPPPGAIGRGRAGGGRAGAGAGAAAAPGGAAAAGNARGQRGGPGGAPAFPREGGAGRADAAAEGGAPAGGGRGGRAGGPGVLRLHHEPALAALAASGGDAGQRATALLARIEWPGKPGASAPVAPLSAVEQARFTAGQEVYKSVCEACHQPDGRGQERIAPPLVGSALALAPSGVPARILFNGKEGKVGLMPPLGSVLSDDQIAAVLTYVRREWGQAGSPVDAASVREARTAAAGRLKPWTDAELQAFVGGK
jgi:mono/diheme cytochrome c family protein/HEAT repeat protein